MRIVHHPSRDDLELSAVLHALSDPVRLEILARLDGEGHAEQPCGALAPAVSRSTLSHHLKVLRECGLTQTRLDGTQRLVSLRQEDLEARFPGLLSSVLRAARSVNGGGPPKADGHV